MQDGHVEASVSVPYEITLLSNTQLVNNTNTIVSVPYEITLLSNLVLMVAVYEVVSVPYEITLLSNLKWRLGTDRLKFQYLMKLHYSQTLMA